MHLKLGKHTLTIQKTKKEKRLHMTQKFIGEIIVDAKAIGSDVPVKVTMPSDAVIPPKQEWHKHAIWQFNGKAYKPLTKKAEDSLAFAVKNIETLGFSGATKDGKRKPTSIRYAILTTGIEPFIYIK